MTTRRALVAYRKAMSLSLIKLESLIVLPDNRDLLNISDINDIL